MLSENAITGYCFIKLSEYRFDAWSLSCNRTGRSYSNIPADFLVFRGYTGHEHLDEFNLINMNGRVYDPLLGMFLSPDNYVQMPDATQGFNRYAYCFNNPLIYTDPDGEFVVEALMILGMAYIGGIQANFFTADNPMNPADWDWSSGSTYTGIITGALSGAGMAGINVFPTIPGAIPNGALQAGINVGINGIGNAIDGDPFFQGAAIPAAMGFASGAISGYNLAKKISLNPWTGSLNQEQRAIWLSYKKGEITLEEAMYQLHPELSVEAGCPKAIATGNNGNSRATTYPLDPNGNRIGLLQASRDYISVSSEIEFHNPSLTSGRRFLFTSYHELTHAKMFYNGDMHNYYNILQMNYGKGLFSTTLNKVAYTQAGLKIFSERWAYGAQWARYGINGSRINYVDRMWRSIITNPVTADEYRMLMFSF